MCSASLAKRVSPRCACTSRCADARQAVVGNESTHLFAHRVSYVAKQVGNDDALAFYASLGFVEFQVIPRYYPPRVQPRDCVLMEHRPLGR